MAFDAVGADWVARLDGRALAGTVDPGTFNRGDAYARTGHVVELNTADQGRVLVAEVAGSRGERYSTLVTRTSEGPPPTWTGRCSCPVGTMCKHAVAVLLVARDRVAEQPSADGAFLRGLDPDAGPLSTGGDAGGLFTGQAGWRGEHVRTAPAWDRALDRLIGDSDDAWDEPRDRKPLAILVSQIERAGATPSDRRLEIQLRPTRQALTGTWSTSWGWDQALGPFGQRDYDPEHLRLGRELCRLFQMSAAYALNHIPTAVDLSPIGERLWPWLREAVDAGMEFVPGPVKETPGATRRRSLGITAAPAPVRRDVDAVEIADAAIRPELDLARRDDGGIALHASLVGVPGLEGSSPVAHLTTDAAGTPDVVVQPLGSPVHGVAVLHSDRLTLAPVSPVLPAGFDSIFVGEELLIPPGDVDRFLSFYYPRLKRRLAVVSPDGSVALPDPDPVRVHLRVVPHQVDDIEVVASFAYPAAASGGPVLVRPDSNARRRERDLGAEAALLSRVDVLDAVPGLRWTLPRGGHVLAPSVHLRGLAAAHFTTDTLPVLEEHADLVVDRAGELATYEHVDEAPVIEWSREESGDDNDWLDLRIQVTIGDEAVPLEPLLRALVAGDEVLLLDSGTWFHLDHPSLDRLRELIEEARALGDPIRDGIRVSRFQVDLFAELLELGVVDEQSRDWAERMLALRDGIVSAEAVVPEGITATLRPYQREGFQWLATLWDARLGAVLADDMGLGKTLQTLALVQRAKDRGELEAPVLVVAPTSVLSTWEDEARRFAPGLSVEVVEATTRRRRGALGPLVAHADLVVTSYAVFRIDAESFRAHPWAGLVLDEAQTVKNSSSQTYQAARRLRAPFKLVVTGTPLENSLMDLWSLLSIAAPGLYPRRDQFSEHYRRPIELGGDAELLGRLRRRIRPIMLRRTKEQVAPDLPPKQVQVLPVPLAAPHQRVYDQHLQRERQRVLRLLDDADSNRIDILAALTRLRQLALDPSLVDDAHAGLAPSAKVSELVDHLSELRTEGHRALVFSQFTGYLRLVEAGLREAGIETSYLDGSTRGRRQVIGDFRRGTQTAFLISLKAGGTGLTLTEADYVFILDPWWNPATEEQAIDRTHRIGQTKPVMVYRMVSAGTIEEKVVALQDRKRDLFTRVVEGGDPLGGVITDDDIRALLDG